GAQKAASDSTHRSLQGRLELRRGSRSLRAMRARIPTGMDLEDKLLYGLSPARLGYVVVLAVPAAWFLRQPFWLPLRILPALLLLGLAAALGWYRYQGRHLDG